MGLVVLVCFVVVMLVWLLALIGVVGPGRSAEPGRSADYSGWLAWFACLLLGLAAFVVGAPAAVVVR